MLCLRNLQPHTPTIQKGNEPSATDLPPLSVIIVTKDSGSALNQNLPAILEQDYPKFEVIVINDKSAGEDEDILKLLSDRYENLYHTFIPKTARYVSRKNWASPWVYVPAATTGSL